MRLYSRLICLVLFAASCTTQDTSASDAPADEPANVYQLAQIDAFCDDINDLQTGELTEPEALNAAHERMNENGPPEIAEDVQEFLRLFRIVDDVVKSHEGDPEGIADAVRETDGAALELLEELQLMAQTGQLGDGVGSIVIGWAMRNCGEPVHQWDQLQTSASFWIQSSDVTTSDEDVPVVEWLAEVASSATASDGLDRFCVDGSEFEQLRTEFGGDLTANISSGDQVFELRLVGPDPQFQQVSCPIG